MSFEASWIFSASLLPEGAAEALDQRVFLGLSGGGNAGIFIRLFSFLKGRFLADLGWPLGMRSSMLPGMADSSCEGVGFSLP